MKMLLLICITLIAAGGLVAQPAADLTTYAAAKAEAEKWLAVRDFFKADPAIKKAFELARTDAEKAEATLMYAPRVRYQVAKTSTIKPYRQFNEAYQLYQDAIKLPGLPAGMADELRLAAVDLIAAAVKDSMTPPTFVDRIRTDSTKPLVEHARAEYNKLINSPSTPPSIVSRAYVALSKTRNTTVTFGNSNQAQILAAAADLRAAAAVPNAPDRDKAAAYLEMVELAQRFKDVNAVAGAYDAVTKLPAAAADQKIRAYKGLVEILLANSMIKASRDRIAEAHKITGLSSEQKAVLSRLSALTIMVDVDPSDPAAAAKAKKAAIAELDKAVRITKYSDDEKLTIYLATGEYLQNIRVAYPLAIDQLQKALVLRKLSEEKRAEVQYAIGETYRINQKFSEAKAEYLKVSKANPRFSGYAQSRIKEVEAAMAKAGSNP